MTKLETIIKNPLFCLDQEAFKMATPLENYIKQGDLLDAEVKTVLEETLGGGIIKLFMIKMLDGSKIIVFFGEEETRYNCLAFDFEGDCSEAVAFYCDREKPN